MRHAFTLTELCVCLAIMTIVVSLAFVGLGASREASRRMSCQNNLRQTGLALHQFADRHRGELPYHNFTSMIPHGIGPWFELAPELELATSQPSVLLNGGAMSNIQSHAVFSCPSDGQIGCNYRACGGSGAVLNHTTQPEAKWSAVADGCIPVSHTRRRLAEVTDGTSNTVFASERQIAAHGINSRGDIAYESGIFPPDFSKGGPPHQALVDVIAANWDLWPKYELSGKCWHRNGIAQSAYNHVVGPNHPIAISFGNPNGSASIGIVPATSQHPGGVNICRVDGSVAFVADQIDSFAWYALATIAKQD